MRTRSRFGILACAVVLGALIHGSSAQADEWNKKTIVSLKDSIKVPGRVLTPGKYVFKLVDSASNRNIVQIMNQDETQVLATIIAIPKERSLVTDKTEFRFFEGWSANYPPALKAWFYPGEISGLEFAYPRREAAEIASLANADVTTITQENGLTSSETPQESSAPSTSQTTETTPSDGQEDGISEGMIESLPNVSQQIETSRVEDSTMPATMEDAVEQDGYTKSTGDTPSAAKKEESKSGESESLPKTASIFPLAGLTGLFSLGIAFLLRVTRGRDS